MPVTLKQQGVGEFGERGEMEISEEDEAFAEVLVFLLDGFLDLDDHFSQTPDVVS